MKVCTKCGEEKPLNRFCQARSRKDGFQPWCKACTKVNNQTLRARETKKKYRQTPKYKEAMRKRRQTTKYKKANKKASKKYFQTPAGKQVLKENAKKYRQTPRGKEREREKTRKRKARKLACQIEPVDEANIWNDCKGRCIYCGSRERLSLDHIVALARGGPHCEANLVLACKSCNSSKGKKLVTEWVKSKNTSRKASLRPLSRLKQNKKLQPFLTKEEQHVKDNHPEKPQ